MRRTLESLINKQAEALNPNLEKGKFALIELQTNSAVEALKQTQPLLLDFYDNTHAAGPHILRILDDPRHGQALVQIPTAGSSFPTMLHGIEFLVWLRTQTRNKGVEIPAPTLHFTEKDRIAEARKALMQDERPIFHTLIPLNVDPNQTQLLVFNRQARGNHIDPYHVATSYYHHIQNGGGFGQWPFHTMLVTHTSDEPKDKYRVAFRRDTHTELHGQGHRLLNPQRIDPSRLRQ